MILDNIFLNYNDLCIENKSMDNIFIIGNLIKIFAETCYRSQAKFARAIGIHPTLLNRYVKGANKPGIDTLAGMYEAGMNLHWLITGGQGNMFAPNKKGSELLKKHGDIWIEENATLDELAKCEIKVIERYGSINEYSKAKNLDYFKVHEFFYGNKKMDEPTGNVIREDYQAWNKEEEDIKLDNPEMSKMSKNDYSHLTDEIKNAIVQGFNEVFKVINIDSKKNK